jgi:hypothetical protein
MMIDRKGCLQIIAAALVLGVVVYAVGKMVAGWLV